jgi:hypothetical protein
MKNHQQPVPGIARVCDHAPLGCGQRETHLLSIYQTHKRSNWVIIPDRPPDLCDSRVRHDHGA